MANSSEAWREKWSVRWCLVRYLPPPHDVHSHSQYLLGWRVGCKVAKRSFLSIWSKVVLPALSRPKKRILAFLFMRPRKDDTLVRRGIVSCFNVYLLTQGWQNIIKPIDNEHDGKMNRKKRIEKEKTRLREGVPNKFTTSWTLSQLWAAGRYFQLRWWAFFR